MIDEVTAIRVAIGLVRVPSRVRPRRSQALPAGVPWLLRIAAGDGEAERNAAHWTGESPALLREAAAFFIEQILLSPDSDHYRVLGATPDATNAELRRNMGLLLKGMHPDVEHGVRSVLARRVTSAWDSLKTADRRRAYDASRQKMHPSSALSKTRSHRIRSTRPWLTRGSQNQNSHKQHVNAPATHRAAPESLLHRILRLLFTGVRA